MEWNEGSYKSQYGPSMISAGLPGNNKVRITQREDYTKEGLHKRRITKVVTTKGRSQLQK